MANSDKVITVTPATGSSNEPSMVFTGGDNNPLTMRVMDDGTLSYEASEGQVFSVSESLSKYSRFAPPAPIVKPNIK